MPQELLTLSYIVLWILVLLLCGLTALLYHYCGKVVGRQVIFARKKQDEGREPAESQRWSR